MKHGTIRIPIVGPTKRLFPLQPGQVEIELRGRRKTCRWHPHYDHDKERSGVIGIGIALLTEKVREGERLAVQVRDGVFYLS